MKLFRAVLVLLVSAPGLLWASQVRSESPVPDLSRQVVDRLVEGRPVEDLMARVVVEGSPPPTPQGPQSRVGADVGRAYRSLVERSRDLFPASASGEGLEASSAASIRAFARQLSAQDLLYRDRFGDLRIALERAEVGDEILQRLEVAEALYHDTVAPWVSGRSFEAAFPVAGSELEGLLVETLADATRILRAGRLPFGGLDLSPRVLIDQPSMVPSYLDATDPAPIAVDREGSPLAPLSTEIVSQAEALGFDPLAIYEFVRNEIETEWYAGAMKGAVGTLRHGAGNDVDQAALLVALMRASSQPARFVRGVVQRPLEDLEAEFGVTGASEVVEALSLAGIAHRPVVRGGQIAALDLEHTWVSAWIPYSNYRGAVVDLSGRTWVPLAPSIKRVERTPASGILRQAGIDVDQALVAATSVVSPATPLQSLRESIEDFLATERPDETYAQQLGQREIVPLRLGAVPSSLPVAVLQIVSETAALPDSVVQRVRLELHAGTEETSEVILELEVALPELIDRRVTLSYLPETIQDHRTLNLFGGLGGTPPYLVRLRPQLAVAGHPRAVGTGGVDMARPHRLSVTLYGPWGEVETGQTMLAGGYASLAFGAQQFRAAPDPANDPEDYEPPAARILSQTALTYGAAWDAAEEELAALLDVGLVRPVASLVLISNEVAIEWVGDLPVSMDWTGVSIDAALRVSQVLDSDADPAAATDWRRLAGLEGSALEHQIFADRFLVESISAERGLAVARGAGVPVYLVDTDSLGTVLPLLDHPDAVLDDLQRWAARGFEVEIPATEVEYHAWQGSIWRVEDPASGAAGYFIAGGLAGGQTAEDPQNWVLGPLVDELQDPYGGDGNTDPLSARRLVNLAETDGQVDQVFAFLPQPLSVVVLDELDRPVQGAQVTFSVWGTAGKLANSGPSNEVVVESDDQGIARARFQLGTETADNPVYYYLDEEDQYPTQVLKHEILVSVASHEGPLQGAPFTAYALPDVPVRLIRPDGRGPLIEGTSSMWVDTIVVRAVDRYDNPVSNVDLLFQVGPQETAGHCADFEPEPDVDLGAALFSSRDPFASGCVSAYPLRAECGESAVLDSTSAFGAQAGVLLGDDLTQRYSVQVSSVDPDLPPLTFQYQSRYWNDDCRHPTFLIRGGPHFVDEEGQVVTAAKVGALLGPAVEVRALRSIFGIWIIGSPDQRRYSRYYPAVFETVAVREIDPTVPTGHLGPNSEGWLGPELPLQLGPDFTYRGQVQGSSSPRRNRLWAVAQGYVGLVRDGVFSAGGLLGNLFCALQPEEYCVDSFALDLWSVDPTITRFEPAVIETGAGGGFESPVSIDYRVTPFEYRAASSHIVVTQEEEEVAASRGEHRSGPTSARFQQGVPGTHARVVLNRGSAIEVRSGRVLLPLAGRLFGEVTRSLRMEQDVDLVNGRMCSQPARFDFELLEDAEVTLTFRRIEGETTDGEPIFGEEVEFYGHHLLADHHMLELFPGDLLPGRYRFLLEGRALDGTERERQGTAFVGFRSRDDLPVGHVLIEGVDLFDGHLVVSREDLSVPGRGVPLELARTYSSGSGAPGAMGQGWSHSYESKIVSTSCGEVIVVGGEGSGMRFLPDGAGGYEPAKGYHGTLVRQEDADEFDFYAKNGNRYHFTPTAADYHRLDWIADPNGNTTRLIYAGVEGEGLQLAAVEDPSGRRIQFHYVSEAFAHWDGEVVERVEGPGGLSVHYEYDGYGNLVRVSREPHADGSDSRVEVYAYGTDPTRPLDERSLLLSVTDPISTATTSYVYEFGSVGLQGNVQVPRAHVVELTQPEGGTFTFAVDRIGLPGGATELTTTVTDPRQFETVYTMNRYGSPLEIVDPLGHSTSMVWSPDDVLMISRTDGNQVTTTFDYDEHGNLLSETTEVTDADGDVHTVSRRSTYVPPESLDPPFIKNRVATRTDGNQHTTSFEYDLHGNLLSSSIDVTDIDARTDTLVTSHIYLPNGDRRSTTNPREYTTRFDYDGFGNLRLVTDPQKRKTESVWDARSRLVERIDPGGRTTSYSYDTLDRLTETHHPEVASGAAVDRMVYDDAARTVTAIDAEERATVTRLDREGRIVHLENAAGGTKVFDYDLAGNKVLESSWFDDTTPRHDTVFAYDDASRLVERREPLNRVTTYHYDGVGNLTGETVEEEGNSLFAPRVMEYDYDELNRKIRTRRFLDELPVVEAMILDAEGNAIRLRDPLGRETLQEFDALNRRIEVRGPEWKPGSPRTERFYYDENGNLISSRLLNEPDDQTQTYTYDPLDRLEYHTDATQGRTRFWYYEDGNLGGTTDPRQYSVSYRYDALDRRIETLQRLDGPTGLGWVSTFHDYDLVGNLVEETRPNGNVVTHEYDELNRRTESSDLVGPLGSIQYDARGNQIGQLDANGNRTTNSYDALDRLVAQALPEDRTLGYGYDVVGNRTSATNGRGHTTSYAFDTLDRLVEVRDPVPFQAQRESYTYDLVGNRLSTTNRRGFTTDWEYDDLDRVRRVLDPPLGAPDGPRQSVVWTYDAAGNRLTETDRRSILTESTYDASNRLRTVRRAGQMVESRFYDAGGKLIFLDDAREIRTGYQYDERGLLISENLPLAGITKFQRDALGDVIAETDPRNRVINRTYDLRQRLVAETNHAQETARYEYDGNGNRTAMVRPLGVDGDGSYRWEYDFDGADRLIAVRDPLDHPTVYAYDQNSNRIHQTDAEDSTTVFHFDELDRLTAMDYPGGLAHESYSYDAHGNPTGRVDPKNQSFETEYDPLDRPVVELFPVGPNSDELVRLETDYDANGNRTEVREAYSGPTGLRTTRQTFDAFDRLETRTDPFGKVVAYGYDLNGNRTHLTDPDQLTTLYQYDDANRLSSVTVPAGPGSGVTSYQYFNDSRLRRVDSPADLETTYSYDAAGRVATIINRQGDDDLSLYSYLYDAHGNRTEQRETNGSGEEVTTYFYDEADRLEEVVYPEHTTTYTYDGVGNRLTETALPAGSAVLSTNRSYHYNARHQLESIVDHLEPSQSVDYTFDANGNQTSKTQSDLTTRFRFDNRDRVALIDRDLPGGGSELLGRYLYDYQGLRVEKRTDAGVLRYTYDDQSVLTQFGIDGLTIAKYEYGPDRLLSLNHAGEGRQFYLFEALGSPVNLVAPDGTVQQRTQYDAWGNVRTEVGESWNPFGFTGHELDDETGLYYARARFYDPEVGRFLSEDPFGGVVEQPPSLHKYLYAHANPVYYVDPTGMCVFGLPCPPEVREAIRTGQDVATAAAEAAAKTTVQVVSGVVEGTVKTVDFASGGGLSGSIEGARTFLETEGSLAERAEAANSANARQRASVVTIGFSEAEDKGEHARELIRQTFDVEGFEQGAQQLAEGIVEGDFEEGLRGFSRILGAASQTTLVVAGAAEGGIRLKGPKKARIIEESSATPGVRERVLANLEQSRRAREASNFSEHLRRAAKPAQTTRSSSLASEFNVAPHRSQPSPRKPLSSHHPIQRKWGEQNVPGYDAGEAPTILMRDGAGSPHRKITSQQARSRAQKRRATGDPYRVDYGNARAEAIDQLREAGVPEAKILEVILEHDGYLFSRDPVSPR